MGSGTDDDDKMEENEWAFCSLWARETIEISECARALVNPRLEGDYFFNRATVEGCDDVPYEQVARAFWDAEMDCHLYFRSQPPPQNLHVVDIMYVLRATKEKTALQKNNDSNSNIKVTECKPQEAAKWVDVFCRSFSVPKWKDEMKRIMMTAHVGKKLDLLLAYRDGVPAGCAALFATAGNDLIGLYCLGTVPTERSKGVAKAILNYAKSLSERRGVFLFLQTLGSENLVGMYKNAGFETAYTKSICAVPRAT